MAAIVAGEILTKYSVAGAATQGNTTAGTPTTTWQGKYMSATAWAGGGTNDVFVNDITGAQNAANQQDYVCLFVHNSNTANAYQNAVIYLSADDGLGASVAFAVDSVAVSVANSGTAQATTATTSTTAPGGTVTGFTYTAPTTVGAGLQLNGGTGLPANNVKAFWIRRTAANSPARSNDTFTLGISGDTGSL